MLLPDRHLVADLLGRYRAWERLVLADPFDETTRGRFEDVAYNTASCTQSGAGPDGRGDQ